MAENRDRAAIAEGDRSQRPGSPTEGLRRTRRRQLHIWLSDREHEFLSAIADEHDESMAGALRRMVRAAIVGMRQQK
jgi:hypothetical protein